MRYTRARDAAKTHKTSTHLRAHVLQLVKIPAKTDTSGDTMKETSGRKRIIRTCGLHHIAPEHPRVLLRGIEAPDSNCQGKQSPITSFMSTENAKNGLIETT
jgi:hypothetical protein